MRDIPPLAQAAIGLICLVLLITNLGLVFLFRHKPVLQTKPPKAQEWPNIHRMVHIAQDPFGEERKQINELSGLVEKLDEKKNPASARNDKG
jgi:hypothetical protein